MDPLQLWSDASANIIASARDENDRGMLTFITTQISLKVNGDDITFVCSSSYVRSLLSKYKTVIFNEVTHLLGHKDVFFGVEIQEQNNYQAPRAETQRPQNNYEPQYHNSNYDHDIPSPKDDFDALVPRSPEALSTAARSTLASENMPTKPRFMRYDAINKTKTFANYVTDPKNTMLVTAAVQVALNPGSTTNNPFYIYGSSGLGKTHILFSIANSIRENHPNLTIVYTRAEEFIRHYVESMANPKSLRFNGQQIHFQDLYTEHNVFIVDDIQNFIKAQQARETFFDIIAEFLDRPNRQLILASDVPPGNLKDFSSRLTSRFGSGVCCEVIPPSVETRTAITMKKCDELGVALSDDIIEYIATHIRSNVREIEGAIKTLNTVIAAYGSIQYDVAVRSLANLVSSVNQSLTIERIKERVAEEYEVSVTSMESAGRKKLISNARSMAMTLARDLLKNQSFNDIGRAFNKDHSSVHEAIKRVRAAMETDEEVSARYNRLYLSLKKE